MDNLKYLLDTNICIYYLNGQFALNSKIAEVEFGNCFISEITILELFYGIANSDSDKKERNFQKLQKFESAFQDRTCQIRPTFVHYATQKARLRKAGTPVSDFDLLIASSALTNNYILVTRNVKEMQRIEGLNIENWVD
ncbi:MAG: PIN domain-containing protein [Ignavibacteria bacterium]|nr:PIN domain-containing protein [Ignavibacteria bacterium]